MSVRNKDFNNIKVHTQYSICEGAIKIDELVDYCKELKLNIVGLMCIPPVGIDPLNYFNEMSKINHAYGFTELSMGMSSDYEIAIKNSSTYLRIGSDIFGKRVN